MRLRVVVNPFQAVIEIITGGGHRSATEPFELAIRDVQARARMLFLRCRKTVL
jgi:hypothetical protein